MITLEEVVIVQLLFGATQPLWYILGTPDPGQSATAYLVGNPYLLLTQGKKYIY